jgi:hypothetical protein
MTKRGRPPAILALLIAVVLAGAYLIVAKNNAAMSGAPGEVPSGLFH